MLILNPQRVELGSATLNGITTVAIDRATITPLEQWGSAGPWCRLADSTKRRVTLTIKQEPGPILNDAPALGTQAELRVVVSPTLSDRNRRRIRCTCVVTAVEYTQPLGKPPVRTITLLGVSTTDPAGATDPVNIEEVTS